MRYFRRGDRVFIEAPGVLILKTKVLNLSGKVLFEQKQNTKGPVDISNLSQGVYFIEVVSETRREIKKFIKQ